MRELRRIQLKCNSYSDLYDTSYVTNSFQDTYVPEPDSAGYDFQTVIEIYANYKHIYSSGVWKWINDLQAELFALLDAYDGTSEKRARLDELFGNLFRNRMLSNGLVSHNLLSSDDESATFTECMERHRSFLDLLLQDIDTCRELTKNEDVRCLSFPTIGNPYGALIEGALILPDQPRHFYDAFKIHGLTEDIHAPISPVIFEIGGGYGGMLINLLKMFKGRPFTYVNCDIFTTAMIFHYVVEHYIRLHCHDNVQIILHQDSELCIDSLDKTKTNVVLKIFDGKPVTFTPRHVDVTYNAHSLSEMSEEHIHYYMKTIEENRSTYFYHINADYFPWKRSYKNHIEINASKFVLPCYQKLTHCLSPWVCGGNERYREFLYKRK